MSADTTDTYTKMRTKEEINKDLDGLLHIASNGNNSTFMGLFFLKMIIEILVEIRDQLSVPTPSK